MNILHVNCIKCICGKAGTYEVDILLSVSNGYPVEICPSPDNVLMKVGLLCAVGGKKLQENIDRVASPLILFTAKEEQSGAIITGIELGADACLAEPFHPREPLTNLVEGIQKL